MAAALLKHQLSITAAATHSRRLSRLRRRMGRYRINYRYQLVGSGETRLAIAPRFLCCCPRAIRRWIAAFGGVGLQTNLPSAVEFNRRFVTHWNAGATWVPRAQNELHQRASSLGANLGQSVVWLVKPRFNALIETVWSRIPQVIAPGRTLHAVQPVHQPGRSLGLQLQERPADCAGSRTAGGSRSQLQAKRALFSTSASSTRLAVRTFAESTADVCSAEMAIQLSFPDGRFRSHSQADRHRVHHRQEAAVGEALAAELAAARLQRRAHAGRGRSLQCLGDASRASPA